MSKVRILPAGDRGLVAEFGDAIDPAINDRVQALAGQLKEAEIPGITDLIPTFRSLLICYEPAVIRYGDLCTRVQALSESTVSQGRKTRRLFRIPCCYGGHFGPDLPDLIAHTGLSREEVISLHSGTCYRIYMLGFLPGFVYLGGLDERLCMPRLSTPRLKIPKGAVGIGGNQTGVYPLDSPGGWRLIGSTPMDFYDPDREPPVLCQAGDFIRFVPINACEYYDIRQDMMKGRWKPDITDYINKGDAEMSADISAAGVPHEMGCQQTACGDVRSVL